MAITDETFSLNTLAWLVLRIKLATQVKTGNQMGKKSGLQAQSPSLMLTKASGITIPLRTVHAETLDGLLALPTETETLVILAQANKSRQQALINKWVSTVLNRKGIGTLLLDLVPKNGLNRRFQFDLMA